MGLLYEGPLKTTLLRWSYVTALGNDGIVLLMLSLRQQTHRCTHDYYTANASLPYVLLDLN